MKPPRAQTFRGFARLAGGMGMFVGVLVLVGWWAQIDALKSVVPGLATMKVNTAACFVAVGLALALAARSELGGWRRWTTRGLAALVVLVGVLTLAEYAGSRSLGIDDLLGPDATEAGTSAPGRMAGGTAFCFALLGASLLGLDGRRQAVVQVLALSTGFIALLALIGYAYGVRSLYGVPAFSSMALHTAAAFFVLASGVVAARPDAGLAALLSGDSAGGTLARRLLPATILLPVLLGWLRVLGERRGFYDTAFGSALFSVSLIVVLAAAVLWVATSLHHADRRLVRAERLFRLTVESAPDAMIMADRDGRIVLANGQAEKLFGYSRQELLDLPLEALVPERFRAGHGALRASYHAAPSSRPMGGGRELFALRKDDSEVPVEVGLNPLESEEGRFVLAALVDISERVRAADALAAKARELARSNAELEQFAYVASHDLQEPLRMVVSYTELLEQRNKGKLDERTDKYIRYIVEGGKRMQGLVNDLLRYSRVGRKGQPFRDVDTKAVVERVLVGLQRALADSGGAVKLEELPVVHGDERQLEMVFQNLIANALKFRGADEPRVAVSAARRDGLWEFCVADNGIGIEPQYHERIFQMFQRLHDRNAYEGSGIGLAVTKKIVEHHGGHVRLESEAGGGSRFYFTLQGAEGGTA